MEQKAQRWTAQRKAELALQIIKGEASMADICGQNDLKQYTTAFGTFAFALLRQKRRPPGTLCDKPGGLDKNNMGHLWKSTR